MEARAGIEPAKKGFAGLPLAAWVPRRFEVTNCCPERDSRSNELENTIPIRGCLVFRNPNRVPGLRRDRSKNFACPFTGTSDTLMQIQHCRRNECLVKQRTGAEIFLSLRRLALLAWLPLPLEGCTRRNAKQSSGPTPRSRPWIFWSRATSAF